MTGSVIPSSSLLCCLTKVSVIKAKAPSPVMLQAVPKLSCKAKIAISMAVPASLNPSTEMTMPNEANTVPPGTPGAPTANIPSKTMNKTRVEGAGK